jgi:hypothetical protein
MADAEDGKYFSSCNVLATLHEWEIRREKMRIGFVTFFISPVVILEGQNQMPPLSRRSVEAFKPDSQFKAEDVVTAFRGFLDV